MNLIANDCVGAYLYQDWFKKDLISIPILLNKTNDDFEVNQSAINIYKMYLNKL